MNEKIMDLLSTEEAKGLHKIGYSVIALCPKTKGPAVSKFTNVAPRKPSIEEQMESASYSTTSYGLLVGRPHGIVVLDLNEENALSQIPNAELPRTVCVKTVRGYHYYFRHPGVSLRTKTPVLTKVDLKSSGYVVIAGSTHPSGVKYEYVTSPEETEIADCPSWIVDLYGGPTPLPLDYCYAEFLFFGLLESPEARNDTLIYMARQMRNDILTGWLGIDDAIYFLMEGGALEYDEAVRIINNA